MIPRDLEVQAGTEGNSAARSTAVMIDVDRCTSSVTRLEGDKKELVPQMNRNFAPC